MLEFWKGLFASAWSSALTSGSSTEISVFYLSVGAIVLTYLLTSAYEWNKGGRTVASFKATWAQWPTYVFPAIALAILWAGLFSWCFVKTIYQDHEMLKDRLGHSVIVPSPSQHLDQHQAGLIVFMLENSYELEHPASSGAERDTWANAELKRRGYPFEFHRALPPQESPNASADPCPLGRIHLSNAHSDGATYGIATEGKTPCLNVDGFTQTGGKALLQTKEKTATR